jgi:TPP-dependent pyruvate/acetoin dehydrogenase alpha subunit|tara:strand:- start:7981 stop:8613 length:633 start_codon:yes stop_codon:yes gene_type:complete
MLVKVPDNLNKVRKISITPEELIQFEEEVASEYEDGKIRGPIHLSKNNEHQLIEIFSYIGQEDWVFVPWRNHYHAILHGVDKDYLVNSIRQGLSMGTNSVKPNFYSSSIVGGIIPIALGTAKALQMKNSSSKVWCFVGDMTFETGVFHEAYKYAKNFDLPIVWVLEDNDMSVHTPTDMAWGSKQAIPDDIIYYKYEMGYPHHGTGKWVNF